MVMSPARSPRPRLSVCRSARGSAGWPGRDGPGRCPARPPRVALPRLPCSLGQVQPRSAGARWRRRGYPSLAASCSRSGRRRKGRRCAPPPSKVTVCGPRARFRLRRQALPLASPARASWWRRTATASGCSSPRSVGSPSERPSPPRRRGAPRPRRSGLPPGGRVGGVCPQRSPRPGDECSHSSLSRTEKATPCGHSVQRLRRHDVAFERRSARRLCSCSLRTAASMRPSAWLLGDRRGSAPISDSALEGGLSRSRMRPSRCRRPVQYPDQRGRPSLRDSSDAGSRSRTVAMNCAISLARSPTSAGVARSS